MDVADGVRLGGSVSAPAAPGPDGFAALVAYQGTMYAAASSSGKVYSLSGDVWVESHDTGFTSIRCMVVHEGKLYVGSGGSGALVSYDGAAWAAAAMVAGAAAVAAMASVLVKGAGGAMSRLLYLGAEYAAGLAKVFSWDGAALAESVALAEPTVESMAVYEGKLYVASSSRAGNYGGRLMVFDALGAGTWAEVVELPDEYLVSLVAFDGLLWAGGGLRGRVYACDGERLVVACDLGVMGLTAPGNLALAVCQGRLFVGAEHPTEGACLVEKLPSWMLVDGGLRVVGAGAKPELALAGLGWSLVSSTEGAGSVRSMGVNRASLYFARDGAGGTARIWKWTGTASRLAGQMDLAEWSSQGEPAGLRQVVVEHDPLVAGSSVAIWASVDGGAFTLLGTSNVAGATGDAAAFASGKLGRRLAIRLALAGADSSSSPVVRGVALECVPADPGRRSWEFDVRCEGAVGAPLILLDGSKETRTGAATRALLWAARAAEVVPFVDVDAAEYRVWVASVAERYGGMPQGRGAQVVAVVRLVEC